MRRRPAAWTSGRRGWGTSHPRPCAASTKAPRPWPFPVNSRGSVCRWWRRWRAAVRWWRRRPGSIPEVVGDAALLVPATPEAFADGLQRIFTDSGLRKDLIARGRVRVERFAAERVAEQTLAAIDLAVARFAVPRPTGAMLSRPFGDRRLPLDNGPRKHDGVVDAIMLSRPGTSARTEPAAEGPRKHGTPMLPNRNPAEAVHAGAPAVSFVVQPRRGGRGLTATLAALAYEATELDEVVILAAARRRRPRGGDAGRQPGRRPFRPRLVLSRRLAR